MITIIEVIKRLFTPKSYDLQTRVRIKIEGNPKAVVPFIYSTLNLLGQYTKDIHLSTTVKYDKEFHNKIWAKAIFQANLPLDSHNKLLQKGCNKIMKKYKAVLSDGGHILFPDEHKRDEEVVKYYKFISENRQKAGKSYINYDAFVQIYYGLKTRSQTEQGYSKDNFMQDLFKLYEVEVETPAVKDKKLKNLELRPYVRETLMKIRNLSIPFLVVTDATKHGKELAEQYAQKLGLIENGKLILTGFLSSKDVGVTKPAAEIFDEALKLLSMALNEPIDKSEVLFIAHAKDEITGAHEYGLDVIAFMEDEAEKAEIMKYVVGRIERFDEILEYLES